MKESVKKALEELEKDGLIKKLTFGDGWMLTDKGLIEQEKLFWLLSFS